MLNYRLRSPRVSTLGNAQASFPHSTETLTLLTLISRTTSIDTLNPLLRLEPNYSILQTQRLSNPDRMSALLRRQSQQHQSRSSQSSSYSPNVPSRSQIDRPAQASPSRFTQPGGSSDSGFVSGLMSVRSGHSGTSSEYSRNADPADLFVRQDRIGQSHSSLSLPLSRSVASSPSRKRGEKGLDPIQRAIWTDPLTLRAT
jgi:hypothetical protein